jgi:hypothetical protein
VELTFIGDPGDPIPVDVPPLVKFTDIKEATTKFVAPINKNWLLDGFLFTNTENVYVVPMVAVAAFWTQVCAAFRESSTSSFAVDAPVGAVYRVPEMDEFALVQVAFPKSSLL